MASAQTTLRRRFSRTIRGILLELENLLGASHGLLADEVINVDDSFVGGGYGVPTPASEEAIRLCARTEALFVDPVYTAKAMAGLIARIRARHDAGRQGAVLAHRRTGGLVRVEGWVGV